MLTFISFLVSIIPLLIVIFLLIVGFCLGFTTHAIFLKIAVRKGRAFATDKNGKWQPFDPYAVTFKGIKIVYGGIEEPVDAGDLKILINGVPAERWFSDRK